MTDNSDMKEGRFSRLRASITGKSSSKPSPKKEDYEPVIIQTKLQDALDQNLVARLRESMSTVNNGRMHIAIFMGFMMVNGFLS